MKLLKLFKLIRAMQEALTLNDDGLYAPGRYSQSKQRWSRVTHWDLKPLERDFDKLLEHLKLERNLYEGYQGKGFYIEKK